MVENLPKPTKGYVSLGKLPLRVMRWCIAGVGKKSINKRVHNEWTRANVSYLWKERWRSKPRVMTKCQPKGTIRWATSYIMPGSTFAYKRGASGPFLQGANKRTAFWTQGTESLPIFWCRFPRPRRWPQPTSLKNPFPASSSPRPRVARLLRSPLRRDAP